MQTDRHTDIHTYIHRQMQLKALPTPRLLSAWVIKGATLPSARFCLARTPHALQYSLVTRIEVEAHGEVLVIIDGDFGVVSGPAGLPDACSAGDVFAAHVARVQLPGREPGKTHRGVSHASDTAGDQQRRLEVRVVSGLRD